MFPHERSLVKKMEGKPFVLLGINSDKDKKDLKDVMEKEKITWRSWFDGGGTSGPIATDWKVRGWPTLFIIDENGVIRHRYLGSPGGKILDAGIDKLVKEMRADKSAE
jgi:hypothetical protein